jgi:hypothetical protein
VSPRNEIHSLTQRKVTESQHSSWLNRAEIELSMLARERPECVGDRAVLCQCLSAREQHRHRSGSKAHGQFTNAEARVKRRKLYSTVEGWQTTRKLQTGKLPVKFERWRLACKHASSDPAKGRQRKGFVSRCGLYGADNRFSAHAKRDAAAAKRFFSKTFPRVQGRGSSTTLLTDHFVLSNFRNATCGRSLQ